MGAELEQISRGQRRRRREIEALGGWQASGNGKLCRSGGNGPPRLDQRQFRLRQRRFTLQLVGSRGDTGGLARGGQIARLAGEGKIGQVGSFVGAVGGQAVVSGHNGEDDALRRIGVIGQRGTLLGGGGVDLGAAAAAVEYQVVDCQPRRTVDLGQHAAAADQITVRIDETGGLEAFAAAQCRPDAEVDAGQFGTARHADLRCGGSHRGPGSRRLRIAAQRDIDKICQCQLSSWQFATCRLAGADRRRRDRNDATRVIVRARCNAGAERRGGQQQRKKGGERFHRAGGTITHLLLTLRAIVIPCPQKVIFGCGQAAIRSRFAPATISR